MEKGRQEEEEEEDGMKAVCGEQIAAACKGSLPCLRAATSNRQMGPAYIPLPLQIAKMLLSIMNVQMHTC